MLERIVKFVLKKWVLITLIVTEICAIAVFLWARAKQNSYPYNGFIIDNEFLDALAMNEFYEAIQLALVAFILFFFTAIVFYVVAYVKYKRGSFYTVYQGKSLIHIFPVDRYYLKKE